MNWYKDSDDLIRREYVCVLPKTKIWNMGLINQWTRFSFTSPRACDYNHIHATLGFSVRIMGLFHKCERYCSSQHNTRVLVSKEICTQHHWVISLILNNRDELGAMYRNIGLTFPLLTKAHSKDICLSLE